MSADYDADINELPLSDYEKNGLQIYRNYNKGFEQAKEKRFASQVDAEAVSLIDLENILNHIINEDIRFIPVIGCAFVDDELKSMFMKALPADIIGGRGSLFASSGVLSSLFGKIQISQAFDFISSDLANDVDKLRKARNKISHSWNISDLASFFEDGIASKIFPIDVVFQEGARSTERLNKMNSKSIFRLRVIWLISRVFYEAKIYYRAKAEKINPLRALYGDNKPELLSQVSGLAMNAFYRI